jgi:hypothetical protein
LFQAVSSQGQCRTLFCLFLPECALALTLAMTSAIHLKESDIGDVQHAVRAVTIVFGQSPLFLLREF